MKDATNDIKLLKSKFDAINKLEWIKSDEIIFENIGMTFEKLIGIPTNTLEIPDFGNIEIKTKSRSKYDYISLFNCVPTGPHYHEIERIKNVFGYPDSKLKMFKVFSGEVFANKLTKTGRNFYFKLRVCKDEKKITLCVYDNQFYKIEETTYWDFDVLEEKLNRKLKYLALINVDKKRNYGKLSFKYNTLNIYKLKSFDTFISLIESGFIKVDFKISVFRDEKRLGKIHDRGTSFSIKGKNIDNLFDYIE